MSKCKTCKRELPNKSFITKNGCIWCDFTYYRSQEEEKRILATIKIIKNET